MHFAFELRPAEGVRRITRASSAEVINCGDLDRSSLGAFAGRFGLDCHWLADDSSIPGSFWGDREAGLIGNTLYCRGDTPVHSLLHEICHFVCMDASRRASLHTNAGGSWAEEDAVCYLQVTLADFVPNYDRDQLFCDMDSWGYSFRLGRAKLWFTDDAQEARAWLLAYELITPAELPRWVVRK